MLAGLTPGDECVVTDLSRVGRTLLEASMAIAAVVEQGASFRSISNSWSSGTGPTGELTKNILLSVAQFEREMIRERSIAGQERARAEGKRIRRPPKADADTERERAAAVPRRGEHQRALHRLPVLPHGDRDGAARRVVAADSPERAGAAGAPAGGRATVKKWLMPAALGGIILLTVAGILLVAVYFGHPEPAAPPATQDPPPEPTPPFAATQRTTPTPERLPPQWATPTPTFSQRATPTPTFWQWLGVQMSISRCRHPGDKVIHRNERTTPPYSADFYCKAPTPTPDAVATQVAATIAAMPTPTPRPTATPRPTRTPTYPEWILQERALYSCGPGYTLDFETVSASPPYDAMFKCLLMREPTPTPDPGPCPDSDDARTAGQLTRTR